MNIVSAKFIKGIVQDDPIMDDSTPQVAFIGRSNVGKSSLINALTKSTISRISSSAGSTREINFFIVNKSVYFVDLPGYGFAKASNEERDKLSSLINSYLFNKVYKQKKVVLIIDSNVGMTDNDIEMFNGLVAAQKDIVVALSKIDKLTQSEYHRAITGVQKITRDYKLFPFSSKKNVGITELISEILS
jgi:GTP-binding protein